MNVLKKSILVCGCAAALMLGANPVMAQQRGNYDPVKMRQDRIDRLRDQLEVKDDADWKALEPLIGKVMDAERDVISVRMGSMFRGNRRNRDGGSDSNSNSQRRSSFFGEPSPAVTALQKAIDEKAPAAELKSKLAAVRAETKDKEAKLEAAQEELRGVLSSRQEAIAVISGILK